MWYAPIGSLNYTINLHNDILIKKYILSEQRYKQQSRLNVDSILTQVKSEDLASPVLDAELKAQDSVSLKEKNKVSKKDASKSDMDNRLNRIKGCAVDVKIKRSFKKTDLDVVTYDSTYSN